MIVVIADDLTGAAEVGGLGLRYGLNVDVVTDIDQPVIADLLVIATDTRSMSEQHALKTMSEITLKINKLKPDLIFKKVDSVLRGHIIAELNVQLKHFGIKTALLVPANPALGRTLTNGNYFIDGQPINLTSFAHDPEFSVTSADVHRMLHVNKGEVAILANHEALLQPGIIVGECITENDLKLWANKVCEKVLLAGGSGFFTAILESLGLEVQTNKKHIDFGKNALFICGSTFIKSRQLVNQVKNENGPVSYMPIEIVKLANPPESLFEQWADEVASLINLHKKAIVAIHENTTTSMEVITGSLREKKARLVKKVFQRLKLNELLIEGGSTAASIIKQLNFDRFIPIQEFSTGVIRMKVDKHEDLFLTLKPGSYDWPPHIWNF
ncbi:four-carbon acid sugar kinase family protein [Mucilaginibacter sp.]|uniref:four-carbon acid sugar kinase family protein n=1 Tax=Mucilaginibacter sp. TaxID=1882438 RepID=UPI0026379074|nr:four-carbon acid sugar kinase family protein [Mucilaginibacter sp.]MDB4922060.1 hypothetical protein [Mucilaginibacter sp.]